MAIHGGVPFRERATKVARIANAIVELCTARGMMRGKANAMKSNDIALCVGERPTGTNQAIRQAIKEITHRTAIPIVSSTRGFFVAETAKEIRDYITDLEHRRDGLNRDITDAERHLKAMHVAEHVPCS